MRDRSMPSGAAFRREQQYHTGTGASAMVLVFVVLCLVTLGILSLSASRADLSLTRRARDMTQGYYQAAGDAQKTLAALSDALVSGTFEQTVSALGGEFVETSGDADIGGSAVQSAAFVFATPDGRALNVNYQVRSGAVVITRHALSGGDTEDFGDEPLNVFH